VRVRAVEPAVDLRELVVHVADLEVAPEAVVVAVRGLHVELAERRGHLLDDAVVAERRVVIIGIDAPEQRLGRLAQEVAEEVAKRRVARVGACREPPAVAELAVHVERELCVGRRRELVRRVVALEQLDGAFRLVVRQRDIGHADVEPVVVLELDVAQIELAVAGVVEHRDLDRVHARRQDLLRDEVARRVDGHRVSRNPNAMALRNCAAAHRHGAARERNVVQAEPVLAVREPLRLGVDARLRVGRRPGRIAGSAGFGRDVVAFRRRGILRIVRARRGLGVVGRVRDRRVE
jgi:hypothetical protein